MMRADNRRRLVRLPWPCLALLIAAAAAVTAMAPATAQQTQQAQDLVSSIIADEAELDFNNKRRTYRGNVQVRHENIHLSADELTMEYNDDGVERIAAAGNPATFGQETEDGKRAVSGSSRRIEFIAASRSLILSEEALLSVGADRIRGERIVYDIDHGTMRVTKAESQISADSAAQ